MAHESTINLCEVCDNAAATSLEEFRVAQRVYLNALGNLTGSVSALQRYIDEAEDDESLLGCLQRIEGLERQAHAVQQHADKARASVRVVGGSVKELQVTIREFQTELENPTDSPDA